MFSFGTSHSSRKMAAGVGRVEAHLVLYRLGREPRRALLDEERAHPFLLPLRDREDYHGVRYRTVRYPHLLAVEHEPVPPLLEAGPEGAAGRSPRSGSVSPKAKIFSPLVPGVRYRSFCSLVPPLLDREHPERGVAGEEGPDAGSLPPYPLDGEGVGDHVDPLAVPVPPGYRQPEQVRLAEEPPHLGRRTGARGSTCPRSALSPCRPCPPAPGAAPAPPIARS